MKPSRPVTRKCRACFKTFKPPRADARYCSAACRQKAHRSRATASDIDRQIEAARLHYWHLIYEKARASGVDVSRVVTDCAQYVDVDGNVFEGGFPGGGGRLVGRTTPHAPGWHVWGLESAGPPWSPPPPEPPPVQRKGRRKPG